MSDFKVGDRVMRVIGSFGGSREGHEYIVDNYLPDGYWDGGDLFLRGHVSSYAAKAFRVVQPASTQQAGSSLDGSDEGWWDLDLDHTPIDDALWTHTEVLGLEVRVQVRRKPS